MPDQCGPGSNGNKGVLRIPQSPIITRTSPWDFLVSYLGHSLGGSYLSAEVHSVYSIAPVDWAMEIMLQTIRIYGQDIQIEFAMLIMKIGEKESAEGIEQPNQEWIRMLREVKYCTRIIK